MTCCPSIQTDLKESVDRANLRTGLDQWVRDLGGGTMHLDLLVPGIHCAGCISRIEKNLQKISGVVKARVNLSTKRVALEWRNGEVEAAFLAAIIEGLGYEVRPFNAQEAGAAGEDAAGRELLRALAVAGFAAANIMLLSVSIWSGADGATRDLFHWLSALIAIPAVGYAGRPFFRSAWSALRNGALNMDVPISLAVLLATGISIYETSQRGEQAFFDASVTLLFFLLIGRYLDHMMRARARSAVTQLLSLNATGATIVNADGSRSYLALDAVKPGMQVAVAAGENFPTDGVIIVGKSDVDRAMVTGESAPETLAQGNAVQAGTINLTAPVIVRVSAVGEDTFLAEIVRLMEAAEEGKASYMRLADRAARIYAPVVHILAALTFVGWMVWSGGDWRISIFSAVAVLIITCPCALGLAVPAVQIVASGMLFKRGICLKDGTALERLAEIDSVLFDKTGTLTLGHPQVVNMPDISLEQLSVAGGLARESLHPLSKALLRALRERGVEPANVENVQEHPGKGLQGEYQSRTVRIGNRIWCGAEHSINADQEDEGLLEFCFSGLNHEPAIFTFEDVLREDVGNVVKAFEAKNCTIGIISGDRVGAVAKIASKVGIAQYVAGITPQDKAAYVTDMQENEHKVLMVGDGINDAPALTAAHASMAPSSASDVGRMSADLVFLGNTLSPVYFAWQVAQKSHQHIRQNFALAALYNVIAIPVAVFGYASPLVAAVAMSASSILVTLNALRLRIRGNLEPLSEGGEETIDVSKFTPAHALGMSRMQ